MSPLLRTAVALLTGREGSAEPGQRITEDPLVATALAIKAGNDSDDTEFQPISPLPLSVAFYPRRMSIVHIPVCCASVFVSARLILRAAAL